MALDLTASPIASLTRLNRNPGNRYLRLIRERIAQFWERESPFAGAIEVDEACFGTRRIKEKRGRGAYGKTIVCGLFQRKGEGYTELVPDCRKRTLQAIIRGKVALDSVIYPDGWRGDNGLVDVGYVKHLRVDYGQDEFVGGRTHVNGIEGFWSYAKTWLT